MFLGRSPAWPSSKRVAVFPVCAVCAVGGGRGNEQLSAFEGITLPRNINSVWYSYCVHIMLTSEYKGCYIHGQGGEPFPRGACWNRRSQDPFGDHHHHHHRAALTSKDIVGGGRVNEQLASFEGTALAVNIISVLCWYFFAYEHYSPGQSANSYQIKSYSLPYDRAVLI